jgi:hypothetical protein
MLKDRRPPSKIDKRDGALEAALCVYWRENMKGSDRPMHPNTLDRPSRRLAGTALALAAVAACLPAASKAQTEQPSFEGIWSGVFTTQDNEYWQVEDFTCFPGCTPASYRYLVGLLDDPANDDKPLDELTGATREFMRKELARKSTPDGLALQNRNTPENDPTLLCKPYGLVREAVNALPISIHREGRNLVIDYEEWNETRTIYMDGRGHPPDPERTPLGHSIGRYESDALVVETVGISPDIYYSFQSGGGYSGETRVAERYTLEDDPRRLHLEMTIDDPVTLREPHVITKTWLWTPDVELIEDSCKDVPGRP